MGSKLKVQTHGKKNVLITLSLIDLKVMIKVVPVSLTKANKHI